MRRHLIGLLTLLLVLGLAPPASGTGGMCMGRAVTIPGTDGPDVLVGTEGVDVIQGGAGNDRIHALGGDDIVCAGAGNDYVDGGEGDDRIHGGSGNDRILPRLGDDVVLGGRGDDRVSYRASPNAVVADLRARRVTGEGTDRLRKIESVTGSAFDDTILGTGGPNTLAGYEGHDFIHGRGGDDVLNGGRGRDILAGGTGADRCVSGAVAHSCLLGIELVPVANIGEAGGAAVSPPGDADLIVIGQPGRLWRVDPTGGADPEVFLDISDRVRSDGELGLLGLAFHPEFAENGRLFVDYTDAAGTITIGEFSANGAVADPLSERILLTIPRAYSDAFNHNGGMLAFGPDGYLHIAVGDGGRGGDPAGHGQDPSTLFGTILRIDVDKGQPYGIPPDNPFVDGSGAPEIWAYGLRNPWRFSFDPRRGDLWIGDVGQGAWEEITFLRRGEAGRNLGWATLEGSHCHPAGSPCAPGGTLLPLHEYETRDDDNTCSVIGGHVYRGDVIPELRGRYLFADFCAGWLRSVRRTPADTAAGLREWVDAGGVGGVTSFGIDAAGELYLITIGGVVMRIDPVR